MEVEQVVVRLVANTAQYFASMDAAASRLIGYSAGIVGNVAKHGVQLAATFERNAVAVRVMVGDFEKGNQLLKEITQLAIETPFSSDELVGVAKQLKAFDIETEQIIPTLQALGNVSAGTGTDIRRISLAFGQVKVAGKLMGTELRQFVDAGVPLIKYLAEVMNKPEESIRSLVERGHVGFAQVVEAFNAMNRAGGQFAGMMEVISRSTISGRWQAFKETLEVATRNFALAAMEGLGLKTVLNDLTKSLAFVNDSDQSKTVEAFQTVRAVFNAIRLVVIKVWDLVQYIVREVREWAAENDRLVTNIAAVVGVLLAVRVAMFAVRVAMFAGHVVWRAVRYTAVAIYALTAGLRTVLWGIYAAWVAIKGVVVIVWGIMKAMTVIDYLANIVASLKAAYATLKATIANLAPLLVFALVALGIYEAFKALGAGRYMGDFFTQGLEALKELRVAWDGLVAALKAGDMEAAWGIITAGFKYAWRVMIVTLKSEWKAFTIGLSQGWGDFVDTAGTIANQGKNWTVKQAGLAFGFVTGEIHDPVALAKFLATEDAKSQKLITDLVEASKQRAIKAKKEVADLKANLLANDPGIRESLAELKRATAAGIEAKALRDYTDWMNNNFELVNKAMTGWNDAVSTAKKATEGKLSLETYSGRRWADAIIAERNRWEDAALAALGLAPRARGDSASEYAKLWEEIGKKGLEITPALAAALNLPKEVMILVNKMQTDLKLSKGKLPGIEEWQALLGKQFQEMASPMGISGQARDVMNKLEKELDEGVTAWDKFTKRIALINEAFYGTKEAAIVGAAAIGPLAILGGINGKMPEEVAAYGKFKEMQKLASYLDTEKKLAPAVQFGTSAAQDMINANMNRKATVEESVLQTLIEAKQVAIEQAKYQKEVADAMKKIAATGVFKILGIE